MFAIPKALKLAGLKLSDIDVIELNEAFAAQSLAVIKEAGTRSGTRESKRRRDRAGASAGLHGSEADGERDPRTEAPQSPLRHGHDVRRRRHGRGGDLRELVVISARLYAVCANLSAVRDLTERQEFVIGYLSRFGGASCGSPVSLLRSSCLFPWLYSRSTVRVAEARIAAALLRLVAWRAATVSRVRLRIAPVRPGRRARPHPNNLAKESSPQETKSSRSLLHPFRKPKPSQPAVLARSWPCLRRPCPVCPTGEARNGSGACAVVTNACVSAYGFSCSVQYWSNDCGALARQLEAQRRGIQGRYDLSGSVIYQTLLDQYEQCVRRHRFGTFGSLAFNDVNLFGLP